jgi:hypothetical protein
MRNFRKRARHMVARRDNHQRMEAVVARPPPRLDGIADGVDRRVIDVDAACEQRFVARHQTRQCVGVGPAVDAGDEQPLAAAGSELLNRLPDAFGAAGERYDGFGSATGGRLLAHERSVPDKSGRQRDEAGHGGNSRQPPYTRPAPRGARGVGNFGSGAGHRFAHALSPEI